MKYLFNTIVLVVLFLLPAKKGNTISWSIVVEQDTIPDFPFEETVVPFEKTEMPPIEAEIKKRIETTSSKNSKKNRYKEVADQRYDDLGFMSSVDLYNELSSEEKKRIEVLSKMANSFRLNHKTEDAEYWYSRFIHQTNNAEHYLHYAQVLQSNDNCEEAIKWYGKYKEVADGKESDYRDFIEDCAELKNFVQHDNIEIANARTLNSEHLDFSPIPYREGVLFTSTRGLNDFSLNVDQWTNDNFSDLFYAPQSESGVFQTPKPLNGDINDKFHDGVATFNQGESIMIFTRNSYKGKSKKGSFVLKIYMASKDKDGYWSDAEELPFNSKEYTTGHPTLSKDGRFLYFASNRKGGFGGMDIYVSQYIGGIWQDPINLGEKVNSSGNEIFPFIAEDNTLYFASNGHKGLGGLDIFLVKNTTTRDWGKREHLGLPFNSAKDDFGFYINKGKTQGFFSSSREGGLGKDDIYTWKSDTPWSAEGNIVSRQICVSDKVTGQRLANTKVIITELSNMATATNQNDYVLTLKPIDDDKQEYVLGIENPNNQENITLSSNWLTDEMGTFEYKFRTDGKYQFVIEREGYQAYKKTLSATELKASNEYCLALDKVQCLSIKANVRDKNTGGMLPFAKVAIKNQCDNSEKIYTLDAAAQLSLCMDCGCTYELKAYAEEYHETIESITLPAQNCANAQNRNLFLQLKPFNKPPSATPPNDREQMDSPPIATIPVKDSYYTVGNSIPNIPVESWTQGQINTYFLGYQDARFKEGQVIALKDVYYDFNKYNIRDNASLDLDRVVQLLKIYPSMKISLESHTDVRGKEDYNKYLSRKRAKAARNYITAHGISSSRVKYQGLGETSVRNRCAEGVECTEKEHQENRRTEIRIVAF